MHESPSFDPIWEEKYAAGHSQLYPWDIVVSFVFRQAPRDRPRHEVHILEIGFGTGSNLWFAAREGFSVAGVEGSASGVATARTRFEAEGLAGDLRVGDFTEPLGFPDRSFDLVIDRGALCCCGFSRGRRAIAEVARMLRPGGAFLFTPYSKAHAGFRQGTERGDGLVAEIAAGHLKGFGQICFYGRDDVLAAFDGSWTLEALEHATFEDTLGGADTRAEWRVVARRTDTA
jgi:SAM-dependent methyltransferase